MRNLFHKLYRLKGYLVEHFPLTRKTVSVTRTSVWQFLSFILILTLYMTAKLLEHLNQKHLIPRRLVGKIGPRMSSWYRQLVFFLEIRHRQSISRIDLIELALKNMAAKKTRTLVTVGGMTIGIAAIVFLVSLGYGLQHLVVSRVARLEEMSQADVSTQPGGKMKISDKTLSDLKNLAHVKLVMPLISVVGRVSFHNAVSDMAVYGVTSDYLTQSAIKPVEGKIFTTNALVSEIPSGGEVAGISTEASPIASIGASIQPVTFHIDPKSWIRIRSSPSVTAPILGYTKRTEGESSGVEVWGTGYSDDKGRGKMGFDQNQKSLGHWIQAPVLLWKEQTCDPKTSGDCEGGKYLVLREKDGTQIQATGYFAEINISLTGTTIKEPSVLGVATDSAQTTSRSAGGSLQFVQIASEAGMVKPPETKTVSLTGSAIKQAVVNQAMLKVLGITESQAVGKSFSVTYIVSGNMAGLTNENLTSTPATYSIIGVVPSAVTPLFYVPFMDLRSLGVMNYSQVKVTVAQAQDLGNVRRQIEAMGYTTWSVADTVAQINNLFATVQTLLALLGMVALAVAALGMFNTLTVSLLERTREVGLMKAMGMKSSEVQELFLTESMIMGFCGGVLGIIIGFLAGKMLGVILSVFVVFKGVGFIDVSTIPLPFVILVIFLSLLVGMTTGIYPAKRATKISALDALRYE